MWRSAVTQFLKATPLLVFAIVAYFAAVIVGPGGLDRIVFAGTLPSGASWALKTADLVIGFGLLILFVEIIKSTRSTVSSLVDQLLSIIVFTLSIVLFLLVRPAGTATFLLLTLMSFVDVLAAFVITVSVSRRDVTIERSY